MKLVVALMLAFTLGADGFAKEFKLYALLLDDTKVELSDGAIWMMDKGDVFPVEAYKNQREKIVLRLAGATFLTETARTRLLEEKEVAEGLEVYRKNVRAYLESTSKKIQKSLEAAEAEAKATAKSEKSAKP